MPTTSVPSASEIINVLLIAFLVPMTIGVLRRFRHPPERFLTYGYALILLGFVLGFGEHLVRFPAIQQVKQVAYALGGVAYGIGMWRLNLMTRRGEWV